MALIKPTTPDLRDLESQFKENGYEGNLALPSLQFIPGKRNLIITAPHSIKTTEKDMETRDIIKAISLALDDPDDVLKSIVTGRIITNSKDLEISAILYNGKKRKIGVIANSLGLNPYVLRYYFYKTALERKKAEEFYTGAYTLYLAKVLECHAMVRNNNLLANAAADFQNPNLISYIKENSITSHIDFHGARYFEDDSENNFDLAVGTNYGLYLENYEAVKEIITTSLASYEITRVDFNSKFQATLGRTLCNQVYRCCGIDTMQFETNGKVRKPVSNSGESLKFLYALAVCIDKLITEKGRGYGRIFKSWLL